jgi:hypothetical protein
MNQGVAVGSRFAFIMLVSLSLAACGSGGSSDSGLSGVLTESLPATVEGTLMVDISEGDDEFGAYANFNFGNLVTGDKDLLVEVEGSLLGPIDLPEDGARVRATLGSQSGDAEFPTYKITALERL